MRGQIPFINLTNLKEGDADTFKCLFNHLYPELYLFANSMILDPPIAEDIVIESFVNVWIRRWDFESISSIRSFLFISTKNGCLNYLERASIRVRVEHEIEIQSVVAEETTLAAISRREIINEIFNIIKELPPKCQKIMFLVYSEGLCNQKIAEIMGISTHTVRNQKRRGLQILIDKFNKRNSE